MKLALQKATLIKRYKRFLADVTLADGTMTTLHVANTGAMTGCAEPDDTVWYSTSENAKRKYPFSWEVTEKTNGDFICVNTIRANHLVEEAILNDNIPQFLNHTNLKREVKYGNEVSKVDFFLVDKNGTDTYIEVKSVTLLDGEQGYFPDTVTTRGQKHLRELIDIAEQGHRAVLFFAVLHSGINTVKAAAHIDPNYAKLLTLAENKGVEIIVYQAIFTQKQNTFEVVLNTPLSINTQ